VERGALALAEGWWGCRRDSYVAYEVRCKPPGSKATAYLCDHLAYTCLSRRFLLVSMILFGFFCKNSSHNSESPIKTQSLSHGWLYRRKLFAREAFATDVVALYAQHMSFRDTMQQDLLDYGEGIAHLRTTTDGRPSFFRYARTVCSIIVISTSRTEITRTKAAYRSLRRANCVLTDCDGQKFNCTLAFA
jgi:hypothetical protein